MSKSYFVVTAVVKYNDKVLILKKAPNDYNYPNCWSFCSGYIKEFEAGEDTIIREIKEETGLDATIIKQGKIIQRTDPSNGKTWIILPFLCHAESDKVTLDHENVEFSWITKDDVGKYEFVPGVVEDISSTEFF